MGDTEWLPVVGSDPFAVAPTDVDDDDTPPPFPAARSLARCNSIIRSLMVIVVRLCARVCVKSLIDISIYQNKSLHYQIRLGRRMIRTPWRRWRIFACSDGTSDPFT